MIKKFSSILFFFVFSIQVFSAAFNGGDIFISKNHNDSSYTVTENEFDLQLDSEGIPEAPQNFSVEEYNLYKKIINENYLNVHLDIFISDIPRDLYIFQMKASFLTAQFVTSV